MVGAGAKRSCGVRARTPWRAMDRRGSGREGVPGLIKWVEALERG
jgi:hypothetical protein